MRDTCLTLAPKQAMKALMNSTEQRNCSFGELTSSLIKDRIIAGIHDNTTRQKLLSEKGLTLEKCLEIARSYEATKLGMKAMQDKTESKEKALNRVDKQ